MTYQFTGKIHQVLNTEGVNDGSLVGDMCISDNWDSESKAWLEGRTNGTQYDANIVRGEDKLGTISYKRLPHNINGLVALGSIKLVGVKKLIPIAVFRKEEAVRTIDEDGEQTSAMRVYHFYKMQTPEEIAKYQPKAPVCLGNLM